MHSCRQINSVLVGEGGHILTILLTGGIGSGKSLAAKYLADMGVPVYDFDSRTKELYERDLDLCGRVAEAVRPYTGEGVLTEDGHIDRPALARTVFGNSAALEALEAVVHLAVLADFKAWRAEYSQKPMVAAESAIALSKPLFAGEFDKVILITASEELRKSRVVARDGLSETEVESRMCAQSGADMDRVEYIIKNDGEKGELALNIMNTITEILKEYEKNGFK